MSAFRQRRGLASELTRPNRPTGSLARWPPHNGCSSLLAAASWEVTGIVISRSWECCECSHEVGGCSRSWRLPSPDSHGAMCVQLLTPTSFSAETPSPNVADLDTLRGCLSLAHPRTSSNPYSPHWSLLAGSGAGEGSQSALLGARPGGRGDNELSWLAQQGPTWAVPPAYPWQFADGCSGAGARECLGTVSECLALCLAAGGRVGSPCPAGSCWPESDWGWEPLGFFRSESGDIEHEAEKLWTALLSGSMGRLKDAFPGSFLAATCPVTFAKPLDLGP